MKKLISLAALAICFLIEPLHAQTTAYVTNCGISTVNGTWNISGPFWVNANGVWSANQSSNIWYMGSSTYNSGYPTWKSITTNFFGAWTNTGLSYVNPPPTVLSNAPAGAPVSMVAATLVHFWPTNGGKVTFHAFGWNNSESGSNVLSVLLGTNTVFASTPTAGRFHTFQLNGDLDFDGTNLNTGIQFASGDTNNPLSTAFMTLTNFDVSSVNFALNLDPSGDTNLLLVGGQIISEVFVPGYGPAQLNFVTNYYQISPRTITTATNSTFGLGAGLLVWDTNYIYVSVGTNQWKRAAVSTW